LASAGRAPTCASSPSPLGSVFELGLRRRRHARPQRFREAAVGAGEDGAQRAVQRVKRVQRGAAVHARVRRLRARADLDVGEDHPARGERQSRRGGVDHAAVEDDHRVGAALVGAHPLPDVVGAGLLGALDQHADVHRERPVGGHRAGDVQQREEVALVVGRAAGI
jgi:hypothetical protein